MSEEDKLFDPELTEEIQQNVDYTEHDIKSLNPREHLRIRPTMYIGKTGNGANPDDGIYVLLKEVLDNAIDEYMMGYGKQIVVDVTETTATVRDYGRGIPLGSLKDAVSKMNTSGKFGDTKAFQKSVGLNGVGVKAVNALSQDFIVESVRDGLKKRLVFSEGILVTDEEPFPCDDPNGTFVQFTPDNKIFKGYRFLNEFVEPLIKNYTFLNVGLAITLNGKRYISRGGLADLLREAMTNEPLYPTIHLKGEDIEIALTHANQYGEEYYSFVNSQHTTQGGTHLTAFKEAVARTIKEYFGKNFEYSDIRNGMVAAVSVRIQDPQFESQTKIKLTSSDMGPEGPKVVTFINNFVKKELDNYLHRNLADADVILKKVQDSERQRKAMAGVTKQVRERNKKISLNNRKLLDCRVHLNDQRGSEEKKMASSIFITEGDSAAGSITKIRDVETQAVFSLRGKPLNTFGLSQKEVYLNEEFSLLQAALNIENGIDGLRYNNVIIATDADVDGMHIRLLMLTYFLQFFPDMVKKGHVYVLQTPLFRVRNKETIRRNKGKRDKSKEEVYYCYTDQERLDAIAKLGKKAEITRFKGLGEISPDEFRDFIGPDMRVDRVSLRKEDGVGKLLEFYMGKNTSERQTFIIDNLVIEDDTQIL